MAWLERLDTRAERWPVPAYWAYLGLKWYLAALGWFAMFRVGLDRTGAWPFFK